MNGNTVTVYDIESGAVLRVSSSHGEIARALAIYDAQLESGEMTQAQHNGRVRVLSSMLDLTRPTYDDTATDAQHATRANKIRATRDYEGYWSDEMLGAFTASL